MKPLLRYAFPELPDEIMWRKKICQGEGVGVDPIVKPLKKELKEHYKKVFK